MHRQCFSTAFSVAVLLAGSDATQAARSPDAIWNDIHASAIQRSGQERLIVPIEYRTVELDRAALDRLLAQAPQESARPAAESPVVLTLPAPDGSFQRFGIVDSPIMEPALAARFPEIRTWAGQGLDDPTATLRFDVTPFGFHAQVLSAAGSWYIDPYQRGDVAHYIAYAKSAVQRAQPMSCAVDGEPLDGKSVTHAVPKLSSGGTLRTYRVAVAATGEYTAFHGGTVAGGQAAIVTTVNRVNGIYEREVAVRMVLIANNNLLVYTNSATDPYSNNDGVAMLGENQTNVTTVIGSANYDFGHVVSTGGGGVAGLGVICSSTQKARGVTGSPAPVGDPFDVDYVAHEMGHQFGGNHTFNSTQNACGDGNRNASTAYETGSGITIQAYAGICSPDNVQNNSVDYFHRASLNEILAHVTSGSGATCGSQTATGNTPPSISTGSTGFTIPRSTPFELTASGSDANGDTLTYLWEQYDLGPTNPAGSLTDNGGPLFRNYSPSTSPSRIFPNPSPTSPWELLPSTTRALSFRVTARDNRVGGGGTNEASATLNVTSTAGPVAVTAPNTAVTWLDGTVQNITWDVANSNLAPVSTANVRIRLSTDGGASYATELAASVPNNGSASVFVPVSVPATTQARIRVEAVGNVWFDTSNVNFTINDNPNPQNQPVLSIASVAITTGNNLLEPNECNQLNLSLSNTGTTTATGVSATLSTSDPNVTITQATSAYADIAAGGSQTNQTSFQLSSTSALVCASQVALTLTVSYGGGGSPFVGNFNLDVGNAPPPNANYSFATSTGATIPAGGTLVSTASQADDALVSLTVPSGFPFTVYGTSFTGGETVRASTNGTLQLVSSAGSAEYANGALPSAGTGNGLGSFPASLPVLLPFWDDLDTGTGAVSGGGIFQQVTGSPPNRTWVIEWRGEIQGTAGTAITQNFAILIPEGGTSFQYVYATATGGGAGATIGVQSAATGTRFTQFSQNNNVISAGQRLTASLPGGSCTAGSGGCASTPPGVTVVQSNGNTAVTEGSTTDTYTIKLDSAPSGTVTIAITPDPQLSVSPNLLTFTTVDFAAPQTVTVTAVDDAVAEGAHSGAISHSASGGGYTGVSIAGVDAAITDNDTVTVSSANVTQAEGNGGGTTTMTFTLTQGATTATPFTVNYQTRDDTALAGSDYTSASGTLSFPGVAGTTRQIAVAINADTTPEASERFFVDLTTAATQVQLSPATVEGVISNDDLVADLAVSNARLPGPVAAGQPISYQLVLQNLSSVVAVPASTFALALSAPHTTITWTCSSSGTATCPAPSGTGSPSATLGNLGPGGQLTYIVAAIVAAGTPSGTTLTSDATFSPVAPYSDPAIGNNTASVNTVLAGDAVFANGFE